MSEPKKEVNKDNVTLYVQQIVTDSHCISDVQGEQIYKFITKALDAKKKVIISFNNIETVNTAFLNTAIGQLYGKYPGDILKKNLSVKDHKPIHALRLNRVIKTAKSYYQDPGQFKRDFEEFIKD